jgi:nicotinate phosphoribosyltransferase
VEDRPVVKRSENKATVGGRKTAIRRHKPTGTATEEVIGVRRTPPPAPHDRALLRQFVRAGSPVDDLPSLADSRAHLRACLLAIPWEGLKLSAGDPALPVVFVPGSAGNEKDKDGA